jgi:peptidyl-prolyl cis-trans isomerase C
MQWRQTFVAAALAVALAPGIARAQDAPAEPSGADRVVAIVDGLELRHSDVVDSAASLPEAYQQQIDELFPALVERLIDLTLLVKEGRQRNLQDDPAVRKMVAEFEDLAIRQAFIERQIAEKATDEALKVRYQRFLEETPPQVEIRARHILVESEEAAKAVVKQLDDGADFADLAAKQTIDTAAAAKGGDLGFFTADQMVPEFSEAAFTLEDGHYTKVPVKTRFGWHVIKLEERRDVERPSFEVARPQIEEQLSQELVTRILTELRGKARIEKFNPDGTPFVPAADSPEPAAPAP